MVLLGICGGWRWSKIVGNRSKHGLFMILHGKMQSQIVSKMSEIVNDEPTYGLEWLKTA